MIEIVLAEDQGMLLGALDALLNMEEDFQVVGKAKNGEEAIKLVEKYNPDVCIMDIEMPVMTGLTAAEKLKDHPCKIMILTTFAKAGYFERARKAGVCAYLLKDSPIEELVQSIRFMMEGKRIFAPELVDIIYEDEEARANPLTERETEVLQLVSEGKTTKEIAGELYLSHGTVRNYISIILEKLNVNNRIEAIARFKELGWFK